MIKSTIVAAIVALLAALSLLTGVGIPVPGYAHDKHTTFSAGEPGNPKKPARTIKVIMREEGKKMLFEPDRIEVRKGEQIRFVLMNEGIEKHEFMLATIPENRKHAEDMKRYPDMEHEDPNGIQLHPFVGGEIIWKFTKTGEFEFACLFPGHYEAGMHGKIIVK